MIMADEALARLIAGNQRFSTNVRDVSTLASSTHRGQPIAEQEPLAIILGCSDARVPAEIIFDQGMGDLFVIRVAGNIVAPSLLGSVEFSVIKHHCRLVVVLGHTHCGAVQATVHELKQPSSNRSPNLLSIVNRIQPSVQTLLETEAGMDDDQLMKLAVRANIRASVAHLQHGSQILERYVSSEGLRIIGAEYSLETGVVEFFHEEGQGALSAGIEH
ncbi:MAG: carbonic anhydrase [Granulosicoccus sp.]